MYDQITILDFILAPIYILLIIAISKKYVNKTEDKIGVNKYFMSGLLLKMFGATAICIIYVFHYKGGDTINYYHSARVLLNIASKDFGQFISLLSDERSPEIYSLFNRKTGYPLYWFDDHAFAVVRYSTLFVFLGAKHMIPASILLAWASYFGIWKLFKAFANEFPDQKNLIAYAFLYIPSVIFWGSGILKDTYSFSAACFLIYALYKIFKTPKSYKHYVILFLSAMLLINVKPYILLTVLCGGMVWLMFEWLHNIEKKFIRYFLFPIIIVILWFGTGYAISILGENIGGFYTSIDVMVERAAVIQEDLTRDYYGENSFNIGTFDPSLSGLIKKTGPALVAGLFRPFIWEARNPLMLLSGLENSLLLFLTLYMFFRIGPLALIKDATSKPFIITFSIFFSLLFAFIIGLISANFGALVRYKIPLIPFYLSALFAIYAKWKARKAQKEKSPQYTYKTEKL